MILQKTRSSDAMERSDCLLVSRLPSCKVRVHLNVGWTWDAQNARGPYKSRLLCRVYVTRVAGVGRGEVVLPIDTQQFSTVMNLLLNHVH
jgi:hypothetical protein